MGDETSDTTNRYAVSRRSALKIGVLSGVTGVGSLSGSVAADCGSEPDRDPNPDPKHGLSWDRHPAYQIQQGVGNKALFQNFPTGGLSGVDRIAQPRTANISYAGTERTQDGYQSAFTVTISVSNIKYNNDNLRWSLYHFGRFDLDSAMLNVELNSPSTAKIVEGDATGLKMDDDVHKMVRSPNAHPLLGTGSILVEKIASFVIGKGIGKVGSWIGSKVLQNGLVSSAVAEGVTQVSPSTSDWYEADDGDYLTTDQPQEKQYDLDFGNSPHVKENVVLHYNFLVEHDNYAADLSFDITADFRTKASTVEYVNRSDQSVSFSPEINIAAAQEEVNERWQQRIITMPPIKTKYNEVKVRAFIPFNDDGYMYNTLVDTDNDLEYENDQFTPASKGEIVEETVSELDASDDYRYALDLLDEDKKHIGNADTYTLRMDE